jgi:phage terminase large subunit
MGVVTIPYRPRPLQRDIHDRLKRYNLLVMHRRAGKTVLAINQLIKWVMTCEHDMPRGGYVAPLFRQAKSIAWDYLQMYTRVIPGAEFNQSELRVDLPGGARIQLFGADSPDSLRGMYFDAIVIDEVAQIAPNLWPEIIRPSIADRKGKVLFVGTPKGRNYFHDLYLDVLNDPDWLVEVHKASETGIVDEDELRAARVAMSDDTYLQEFECSWTASIKGTYYGDLINKAREDGRICRIPLETKVPVHTFWDLGRNDSTSIWFMQQVGLERRFVDYYECNGEGLDHYARVLKDKGYLYGDHYLPHDVEVTELSTNDNRREILERLGVKPIRVVPRVSRIAEGIELVRQQLPACWFDIERCDYGVRCLEQYCKDYDETRQVFRDSPRHDWASHGADAFRMFAQGYAPHRGWGAGQPTRTTTGYQRATRVIRPSTQWMT